MKKVTLAEASRPLAQYASELKDDIVVVTQGRRPVAALVPLKNVDRESLALSTHPAFMNLMRRARAEFVAGRTVSLEGMRARVQRMRPPKRRLPPAPRRRGR